MIFPARFFSDRRGNVAVIFSLAMIPAIMATGFGVDYARGLAARAKLQSAIDSAALMVGQDTTNASDTTLQGIADGIIRGALSGSNVSVSQVSLQTTNGVIDIATSGAMDTAMSGIFGATSLSISAHAAVNKRSGQKADIYLLLDNSASMGLAATPAGRDKLYSLVGCAFACHQPEGGQTISNLQVAQQNGILTRLDVLRTSVSTLLARIDANKTPIDTIRVGITSFDDTPSLQTSITTDLSQARSYIQNYQLGGNTLFSNAMPTFQSAIGASGDGKSTAKEFALLITDGVQGMRDRSIGFHPFDSALCSQLKSRGVTMIVLNTEYVPMPSEQPYIDTVQPIQNQLAPALQACASPGYYFSATDQTDIERAFDNIFQSLMAKLYLSK